MIWNETPILHGFHFIWNWQIVFVAIHGEWTVID